MKRILFIFASAFLAFSAGAQNMYEAMAFSQNVYYGTARTMGLNNAVTAVGGDLGTIGINPAGSAVSYYGQATFTLGDSFSKVTSSCSAYGWNPSETNTSRITVPNFAFSIPNLISNDRGLKSMVVGLAVNQTNNFNMSAFASGRNGMNSQLAEFATAAYGTDENLLKSYDSFNNTNLRWDVLSAYQAGGIASYKKGEYGGYLGNSERISADGKYHYVPGDLLQSSSVVKRGVKTDILLNAAFNYDDRLYFGFNVGLPTINYTYTTVFTETPVEYQQFPISFAKGKTYFTKSACDYQYDASVRGVYFKGGLIWLPTGNLRLGAAIQTPSAMVIRERWINGCIVNFENSSFNGDIISPTGSYAYGFRSPYIINLGAAYTFGKWGFLSVDYELTDYSVMRFRNTSYYGSDYIRGDFYKINQTNRYFAGLSHQLRAGAEFKVTPAFALRVGYGFITDPERHWTNNLGKDVVADDYYSAFDDYSAGTLSLVSGKYYDTKIQQISAGVGYSSPSHFFLDLAVRGTQYADWQFAPYKDYYGYTSSGEVVDMKAPRILNSRRLIDASITVGWRF